MADTPPRARPLSPHWQTWRWHVTMAASILHRAAGLGLYTGLLILAGWLLALRGGADAFAAYAALLCSPVGLVILFLITLSLFFHLANGVRHLFWDLGFGFEIKTSDLSAWAAFAFALLANVAFWWALAAGGKL